MSYALKKAEVRVQLLPLAFEKGYLSFIFIQCQQVYLFAFVPPPAYFVDIDLYGMFALYSYETLAQLKLKTVKMMTAGA